MILSLAYLVMGFFSICIAGLPLTYYAFCESRQQLEWNESKKVNLLWAMSPFVGVSVIVGILKLLVFCDIPVKYSAWPLFALSVLSFWVFAKKEKINLYKLLPTKMFLVLFALVLVGLSFSYIIFGAAYYKGYYWEDLSYYGPMGELVRTTPLSNFSELSAASPFAELGTTFSNGQHRISIGIILAYVASLLGQDAASALGFLMVFSNILIFSAVYFVTEGLAMKTAFRYAACFFSAFMPGIVLTQLEGFVSVLLFTAILVAFPKIIDLVVEKPNFWKIFLLGLLIGNIVTILLDGMALVLGIIALAVLAALFMAKEWWRPIKALLLSILIAVALNLPLWESIYSELKWDLARPTLNFIFPYAYSKDIVNRMLFGSVLSDVGGIGLLLSVIALLLVAVGIFGVIYWFVCERSIVGFFATAIVLAPTIFYGEDGDASYAIYKMFSMALPFVTIGIWKFWDICYKEAEKMTKDESCSRVAKIFRQSARIGGTIALSCIFLLSFGNSVRKIGIILEPERTVTENTRVQLLNACASEEAIIMYEDIQSRNGANYLFVTSPEYDVPATWMCYYGRDNQIYFLNGMYRSKYTPDKKTIPLDVHIYISPAVNKCVSEKYDQNIAAQMICEKQGEQHAPAFWEQSNAETYIFRVFSKKSMQVTLQFTLGSDSLGKVLICEGKQFAPEDDKVIIPVSLEQGIQDIVITASNDDLFSLRDWYIQ